jgi:hypothetical protein
VDDLGTRGIRQVRLLSQSQLESAVRDAVAREVLALLGAVELSAEERRELEERAFARLDGTPRPPRAVPPPPAAPAPPALPAFDFAAMEQRLIDEIGRLVAQNWREEIAPGHPAARDQVERLERRIDSLMRALDQIERMMERMPATGLGLAAALAPRGAVAGRAPAEALGGIKNEILEQLFQANLALRELEAGEELSNGHGPDGAHR